MMTGDSNSRRTCASINRGNRIRGTNGRFMDPAMTGAFIGGLIDALTDWYIHWLVDRWIDWLIGGLTDWCIDWLAHWLIVSLIDWLIDLFFYYQAYSTSISNTNLLLFCSLLLFCFIIFSPTQLSTYIFCFVVVLLICNMNLIWMVGLCLYRNHHWSM